MNISYNWLKNYIDTDLSAEQMAEILTDIGLEVEELKKIESVKGGLEGVVVGHVLTCVDHPDSDHLHITTVDVGSGEPLQIVCGAPNVRAGQKVLCATIGTTLYPTGAEEGFKIKRSKIRGVESLGMLCADDELGVGTAHDGIRVLDASVAAGTPAREALGVEDDWLIGIGLTPNRIDAASHIGVARDLAARLRADGRAVRLTFPRVDDFPVQVQGQGIEVTVEQAQAAPRYAGVTIRGCKIAPSPEWMQRALRAVGINPKNNLVDITNYVLHELGQPLHAFDAAKIEGGRVVVRTCEEGTPFVTLDGVERRLSAEDLMICDARKPMCLAGVLGGTASGVSDTTTDIFLESAYFNPVWVRKSAKRHGISTDASFRFERGIDPDGVVYALKRAALLFRDLAGGTIASPITDLYPAPIDYFRFEASLARIDALIGKPIPVERVRTILAALDIEIEAEHDGVLSVAVPPYRVDVQREADLVEEILRIYGYNNVEIPESVRSTLSYSPRPDRARLLNVLSDFLSDGGYTEIMSNSLTKASYYEGLDSYPAASCVRILNPLSNDLSVMRQTLLFGMMEAVQLNINRRNADLKLYEAGNCYYYDASAAGGEALSPYTERLRLGIAVTGDDVLPSWNTAARPASFFTLRATAEKLLARFGIDIYELQSEPLSSELFAEGLSLSLHGRELLQIGTVSTAVRTLFDLKQPVYFLELELEPLLRAGDRHRIVAQELPRFPFVRRDVALLADEEVTFERLRRIAFEAERKLLRSVTLFDVYQGDKLLAGKKSYALGFVLEDRNQTLTEKVIERTMRNIVTRLQQQAGVTVRA